MVAPAVEGIDLFKIAGRSISGWIPSFKAGTASHVRQPFCSQLEERLLLWLEYNPQVARYARGDIGPQFATTYRLPTPKHAPFAISYAFEGNPHDYLPDVVGTLKSRKMFIAEAGMEDDKRGDRNLAKAEAARRLARLQRGVFWIGTEKTLTQQYHYNLVFLHARRENFPAFADIAVALQEVWPAGEVASVEEVARRLEQRWPTALVEKEEDYMRLLKQALEPKDRLVLQAGCQHPWPCFGKPAIVFHDRSKIFTSERARQVLVDRLGIITEQAPPYAPSAKGTVEALFRWMTQRFERRLPNTSYGVNSAPVRTRRVEPLP